MSDDIELKQGAHLSFEGGALYIQVKGFGRSNGNGHFSFQENDLDYDRDYGDGQNGEWRHVRLPKSELEAIRDFLNEHLPPQ